MKEIKLDDINILDIGNTITMIGAIYSGNDTLFLVPFPGTDHGELEQEPTVLSMDAGEMERFLHQTDALYIAGPDKKVFLRKSQRQIDRNIQWQVFERDDFRCRYCGRRAPLTVDHVILWEEGGPTIAGNLISACGACNRHRGSMEYTAWLDSVRYSKLSAGLSSAVRQANLAVVKQLDELRSIQTKTRGR